MFTFSFQLIHRDIEFPARICRQRGQSEFGRKLCRRMLWLSQNLSFSMPVRLIVRLTFQRSRAGQMHGHHQRLSGHWWFGCEYLRNGKHLWHTARWLPVCCQHFAFQHSPTKTYFAAFFSQGEPNRRYNYIKYSDGRIAGNSTKAVCHGRLRVEYWY